MDDDPFVFIEKRTKIKTVSADRAAVYILKGVSRNLPEIVFPLHGKAAVRAFRSTRKVWEAITQIGLKEMRER